jgi:hypothetical protein
MTLSIFDIQKLKETKFEKGVVDMFIRESDPLKVIPIENVDTMSISTRRMSSLPQTNFWRRRGERFADAGQPNFEVVTDTLYNVGSEINLDDADVKDKGPYIENPVEFNVKARVKAITYDIHDKIINGDHATNADSFEGIKKRIAGLASTQTLYTTSKIECRAASLATSAEAWAILNRLEEAKYALDGHGGGKVVAFTDAEVIRGIKQALRILGLYTVPGGKDPKTSLDNVRGSSNDPVGTVWEYDGVSYLDMGTKGDQSTRIVAEETNDSVLCTPIYFVRLGSPYFHLIQYGPLDVIEPQRLDDFVTYRGVISWYLGTRHVHNRFGVKLGGLRTGA